MSDDFAVRLTLADADHLLAACECVLNQEDDGKAALGTGLQPYALETAARKIESVADSERRGVTTEPPSAPGVILGLVPPPTDDFTGVCECGCGAQWVRGKQVWPNPESLLDDEGKGR